jgi:hypothetical protein
VEQSYSPVPIRPDRPRGPSDLIRYDAPDRSVPLRRILIAPVKIRSDGEERKMGGLTGGQLGFRRGASALNGSGDAVAPGASGGDDRTRRMAVS